MLDTGGGRKSIVERRKECNWWGIYAVAKREVNNREGRMLGCWGAIIRGMAEQKRTATRKEPRRARREGAGHGAWRRASARRLGGEVAQAVAVGLVAGGVRHLADDVHHEADRKSTRLNSSH